MLITKRKHNIEIATLQNQLAIQATLIGQLEARAIHAEQSARKLVQDTQQKMRETSEYQTGGEAAYAYADEFEECKPAWESANQDLWEYAACGAILYGQQRAAEAQIAYFKRGACVPYSLASHDQNQVMTAELADPVHGGITIKVNGVYLREIEVYGLENTIEWFSNLVTSPPGWLGV